VLLRCKLPREDYFECLHHGKEVWHDLTSAAIRSVARVLTQTVLIASQIAKTNAIRAQADRIATGQTADDHGHGHGGH
jgi:hypothetical protein